MRLRLLASLALSLVAFASATSTHAQLGGGKVLHIIVPFAAGGVQDILARSISNELGTALGQTVIVENKPGAGGTVGTGQVARVAADGLTVAMAYFTGLAGIDITHIPYTATGEAINEVVAGRAQAVIAANIGAPQFKNDKRVKLLAVTSKQRSRFITDLPSVAESGLPGYEFTSWFGLRAPAAHSSPSAGSPLGPASPSVRY